MQKQFDEKVLQPIANFTAMTICFHTLKEDKIFSVCLLIIISVSVVRMAINIFHDKKHRSKNALIEFAYVLIVNLTMIYLTPLITGFYSACLVIAECVIYAYVINPKYMHRNLIIE